jgi:hypothetical protein
MPISVEPEPRAELTGSAGRVILATNSPQALNDSNAHSRISAGFSAPDFYAKNGSEKPFLSIVFDQVIDFKMVGMTGFEPATPCTPCNYKLRNNNGLRSCRHRFAT